ncbi:MAG: peptidylprolyl isomerase [Bacilli bacterium]|jgi:hypothetical protein|nr:peptidylprolyl isomerase [Bacilli bacterium]
MRKSKITLGIVAGLLSTFALAACDGPTFSGDGHVLTYTGANGQEYHYTAEELFDSYLQTTSGASSLFDSVYKVLVRNYFITDDSEGGGIDTYPDIKKGADNDVAGVKSKAESAADDNGTKYDEEFEKQLDTYGVEDEDELWEHFAYQRMTTEFEDQFYERNIDFIRDAKKEAAENTLKFSGYLEKMAPYHVRHILVKVSAGANALYNSEITEAEAKKLANVGQNLAIGSETFGSLAQLYSEDTGSAEKFGDLGIMHKNKSFINEFQLGVYAYEAINNSSNLSEAKAGLGITDEMSADYVSATGSDKIGTIPYEAFLKLQDYSDVTKDDDSFIVNDNNPYFYPRNIVFNKYFNRHDISVITPNSLVAGTLSADNKKIENENFNGAYNATYGAMSGFKNVPGLGIDVNGDTIVDENDKVLTTKDGKVVLAVRGGTSGDTGYQGFHFIVVERSAFDDSSNNVSLGEYYTTKYPGQKDYPTYVSADPEYVEGANNYKPTYVNFLDQQIKDYKSRAESVEGEIKGFDSNLKYFIYEKLLTTINADTGNPYIKFGEPISYVNSQGEAVTIDLKDAIENWINATRNEADYNTRVSWEKTWETYVEFLEQQKAVRASDKLLSETCAIQYQSTSKTTELWAKEGACYYDK